MIEGPGPTSTRAPTRREAIAWIGAALVLAGLPVREVVREAARARAPDVPMDVSFAPLLAALPAQGEIGYAGAAARVHDVSTARARLQYVLAPRIVRSRTRGVAAVVAWTNDEERLPELLASHGLVLRRRLVDGYVLCSPEAR
jgi:hypothetical protein